MKTPHRRPTEPLISVGLATSGGPDVDVEVLPDEIGAIEVEIGRQFAAALTGIGIAATSEPSDGEPADSVLLIGGVKVAVQHVEVVDAQRRMVQRTRDWYAAQVTKTVREICSPLSGIEIRMDDGMCWEEWPNRDTVAAQALVDHLAFDIMNHRARLNLIEPGYLLEWRFHASSGAEFGMTATRSLDGVADQGIVVRPVRSWSSSAADAQGLLAESIRRKLLKRYARPRGRELWLLAYGPHLGVESLESAYEVLKVEAQSPFARVWAMDRTVGGSDLAELWPTPSWERTGLVPNVDRNRWIAEFSMEDGILGGVPVARFVPRRGSK